MRAIWVGLLALGLGACASGTTIKTGEAKTPVPADQVQIYTDAPENYETLGLVRASSEMGLLDQQSMNYAIKELKKRAGAIGANGVLLSATGKKSTGLSGAFLLSFGPVFRCVWAISGLRPYLLSSSLFCEGAPRQRE